MQRQGTAWTENMRDQLIVMRKAGLKNDQIAIRLRVSPGALQGQITELIRSGRLASRRGLLWGQPGSLPQRQGRT